MSSKSVHPLKEIEIAIQRLPNGGGLPLPEQARIIARAHGGRGPNRDYLFATASHLAELGIEDADLSWLAAEVRGL